MSEESERFQATYCTEIDIVKINNYSSLSALFFQDHTFCKDKINEWRVTDSESDPFFTSLLGVNRSSVLVNISSYSD